MEGKGKIREDWRGAEVGHLRNPRAPVWSPDCSGVTVIKTQGKSKGCLQPGGGINTAHRPTKTPKKSLLTVKSKTLLAPRKILKIFIFLVILGLISKLNELSYQLIAVPVIICKTNDE